MNTPKTRGYDPKRHSALPYVDRKYKELLDQVAGHTERNKKRTVELAILSLASREGIVPEGTALYAEYKNPNVIR